MLVGVRDLFIILSLMIRLNKTESSIFISLFWLGCCRGIDFYQIFLTFKMFSLNKITLSKTDNHLSTGAGLAMIIPPMLAIIGVYFNKHRGLANSIFMSGGSVGGLIFAPVVVKLFDEYGYTGAMLIMSGLLMNIWVAALLMRPIESYSSRKIEIVNKNGEHSQNDETQMTERNCSHSNAELNESDKNSVRSDNHERTASLNRSLVKAGNISRMQSYDPSMIDNQSQDSPLLKRVRAESSGLRQRTISEGNPVHRSENNIHQSKHMFKGVIDAISHSQMSLYTSGEGICGSFIDVNIPSTNDNPKYNVEIEEIESSKSNDKVTCCSRLKYATISLISTVLDIGLLRNSVFLTFLFMAFSMMSGVALVPVYMPTHAKDIGVSNEKIGLLISIMAVIDLVSKLILGVVADKKWISRSTILVIVAVILGTMSHLMRFVNSYTTMIIFVVIAGR